MDNFYSQIMWDLLSLHYPNSPDRQRSRTREVLQVPSQQIDFGARTHFTVKILNGFMYQLSDPISLLILFFCFFFFLTLLFLLGRLLTKNLQIQSWWNLAEFFLAWIHIDWRGAGFRIWCHTSKMAAMTSFCKKPVAHRVWHHWLTVCVCDTVPDL